MDVATLIKALSDLPPKMKGVIQQDAEGNSYSRASDHYIGVITEGAQAWRLNVECPEYTAEEVGMEEEDWEKLREAGEKVLVPI